MDNAQTDKLVEVLANDIVRDVCELPGDENIEADDTLIVSVDDLHLIVTRNLTSRIQSLSAHPAGDAALREANEAYAAVRRIAVEHLKDHPNIERTHRLMALPQALATPAAPTTAEDETP